MRTPTYYQVATKLPYTLVIGSLATSTHIYSPVCLKTIVGRALISILRLLWDEYRHIGILKETHHYPIE
jgi:hypothetical protein